MQQLTTLNYFFGRVGLLHIPAQREAFMQEVFKVTDFLLSKGFEEITEATYTETLINPLVSELFDVQKQKSIRPSLEFMELFNQKETRTQIKKMVYEDVPSSHPDLARFIFVNSSANQARYTRTLEFLFAYLAVKELKALSASFGVKIKNAPAGGDFDCIANFKDYLIHFEAKSGNVRNLQTTTIQQFIDRHHFLAPRASILFLDFEGGEDKLDSVISQFKNRSIGTRRIDMIMKIVQGSKKVYVIKSDILVIDIHNDGNILSNLRFAMQYLHRYDSYQHNMVFRLVSPEDLGYTSKIL